MAENGDEIPQIVETPAETPAEETMTEEQQPEAVIQSEEQAQPEQSEETPAEDEPEYIEDPILQEEEMKKMFVGGIAQDCTDDELKEFFEEISGGKVTDHVIIRKENQDKKAHFGFITLDTSELVDEILLKREQLKFKDRMLDVNRAVPKNNTSPGAHEKTKKLFIANLPKMGCSEDDLMKYFLQRHPKKYGLIESIQLIKKKDESGNKTEENKGYGFILVSSEDLADKMAIQHSTFEFGGRKIELKKSVPNTEGGRGKGGKRGGGHQQFGNQGYGAGGYSAPYGGYGDWGSYGQYPYGGGYDYYGYGGGYAPQRGGGGGGNGRGGRYRPY